MMATPHIDAALVRRYDRPAPRYTSYPSAPQFGPHFDADMLRAYIRRSNAMPIPRDLSIYVHVPHCSLPDFDCGCTRKTKLDLHRARHYVRRLIREIELYGQLIDQDREVVQLHLSDGAQRVLQIEDVRKLMRSLRAQFRLSTAVDRDFSIALDPRRVRLADIASYAELGFLRASLRERIAAKPVGTDHVLRTIDACRAAGFRSIDVELIYGRPTQTVSEFEHTLDTVIAARPERLRLYDHAHRLMMFRARRRSDRHDLPSAALKIQLLELTIEKLRAAGYVHLGMEHFALPHDDLSMARSAGKLQHNLLGYTAHLRCDLLGLGVGAISHIDDSLSQHARDLPSWEHAIDHGRLAVGRGRHLDYDDVLRADVIQQLMCRGEIDIPAVERRHGVDFPSYFPDALARLAVFESDGLVAVEPQRIVATSRGRLLVRIIATCFDRYLNAPSGLEPSRLSHAV